MKKVVACLVGLLLFTGCSSDANTPATPSVLSPQDKRNNFDACVIQWLNREFGNGGPADNIEYWTNRAKAQCVGYLE